MGRILFCVMLFGLQQMLFAQVDSLSVQPEITARNDSSVKEIFPSKKGKKSISIKKYAPEIFETEKATKLKLKFPWREDINVPVPKGFLPSPWTDTPDPDVSWQRALMFPGLGQVYNRSGWKVPIFYLGYGAVGGWLAYTQSRYTLFQRAFFCSEPQNVCEIPTAAEGLGDGEGLRRQRESWRQRRDQAILIMIAWHGISAVEAYVDAHLKDFDVSDELSLKMGPSVIAAPTTSVGVGLTFSFDKKNKNLIYAKDRTPGIWTNGQSR
ncbi:MAG: DUF5683 domain-containing protein [Bacteroidia bacterium]|nr:DUF5683 domain-containing protein [Bacteroidia bacterium]